MRTLGARRRSIPRIALVAVLLGGLLGLAAARGSAASAATGTPPAERMSAASAAPDAPVTARNATAAAVSNTPPSGSHVSGAGCGAYQGAGAWEEGAAPSLVNSGGYTGNVLYGNTSTPKCNNATWYILDVAGTATATFAWEYGAVQSSSVNVAGDSCSAWAYIPTADAGDRDARYDFWGVTSTSVRHWLAWPGHTVDQQNTSGWVYLGAATTGGYATFAVTLSNSDPANPGWDTGAGAMAISCSPVAAPVPTGVTATATGPTTVHVSWTDPSGGNNQFVVTNGNISSTTLPYGTTSFDWGGQLVPGAYMCFAVRAINSAGTSSAYSPYACTTTPVPAPTNVTANPVSPTTILVSWTDNTGGTARYVVSNGSVTSPVQIAGTFIYNWVDLTPGTSMCFKVQAQGAHQVSPWTASVCATTLVPAPAIVTAVATSAGNIHVSWTDTSGGAANFVVGNGTSTQVDLPSGTTSFDWGLESDPAALAAGTYMCFDVTAEQGTGQSPPSSWACATTLPAGSDNYVNMGDSYSAGEGTFNYVSGTDTVANMCHRSTQSYSGQYVASSTRYTSVKNVACTGAVTGDITAAPGTVNSMGIAAEGELAQYTGLSAGTSLVTLTIGGNDLNLVGLLTNCYNQVLTPSIDSCFSNTINSALYTKITNLEGTLESTYASIEAAAPNASVVVLTYPQIFPAPYSDVQYDCAAAPVTVVTSQNQLNLIRGVITRLDTVIKQAAAAEWVTVIDEENAFAGHEMCTADPWVNNIVGGVNAQDESFHPNVAGYTKEAADLKADLDAIG